MNPTENIHLIFITLTSTALMSLGFAIILIKVVEWLHEHGREWVALAVVVLWLCFIYVINCLTKYLGLG